MHALVIDTHELTRLGQSQSGQCPVAGLHRLLSSLTDATGAVDWSIQGYSQLAPGGSRQGVLHLRIQADLQVACVRCLETMPVRVDLERALRLVGTEAQAEQEDPLDDEFDVLVGGRHFDLTQLLEDELLMALPWAPHHEACEPPQVAPSC